MNFEKVIVNGSILLFYLGFYYKIIFVKGLNFYVLEFVISYDEVVKNMFEDGDVYFILLGED